MNRSHLKNKRMSKSIKKVLCLQILVLLLFLNITSTYAYVEADTKIEEVNVKEENSKMSNINRPYDIRFSKGRIMYHGKLVDENNNPISDYTFPYVVTYVNGNVLNLHHKKTETVFVTTKEDGSFTIDTGEMTNTIFQSDDNTILSGANSLIIGLEGVKSLEIQNTQYSISGNDNGYSVSDGAIATQDTALEINSQMPDLPKIVNIIPGYQTFVASYVCPTNESTSETQLKVNSKENPIIWKLNNTNVVTESFVDENQQSIKDSIAYGIRTDGTHNGIPQLQITYKDDIYVYKGYTIIQR
ncbi:MAG: hypothetical protein ACK5LC_10260 [Coprobacillaceae bacterium]